MLFDSVFDIVIPRNINAVYFHFYFHDSKAYYRNTSYILIYISKYLIKYCIVCGELR